MGIGHSFVVIAIFLSPISRLLNIAKMLIVLIAMNTLCTTKAKFRSFGYVRPGILYLISAKQNFSP